MILWLITGFIIGAFLLWLIGWLRSKNTSLTWYEWLIGAIGVLLLLLTIQNFTGSLSEPEPRVAVWYLLWLGLPALILLAITWQLVWRRIRTA